MPISRNEVPEVITILFVINIISNKIQSSQYTMVSNEAIGKIAMGLFVATALAVAFSFIGSGGPIHIPKSHFTGSSTDKEGFGVYTELARYDNWTSFGIFVGVIAGFCILGGLFIVIKNMLYSRRS